MSSYSVQEKVSHDSEDHSLPGVLRQLQAGDIHIWDRESASYLHHIRAPLLGGDMTCIAWNPAADPFMFATGSHDGSVQIWTTPEIPANHSRPAFPIPRTEASATRAAEQGVVKLSVPILREPSHRYIPMREQDSTDTVVNLVPPREVVTMLPEPSNTLALAARRHSWV
jgi:hypothetical protein